MHGHRDPTVEELATIAERLLDDELVGVPFFERLTHSELGEDEAAELERQARLDPELQRALEAYRPLPEPDLCAIVERCEAALKGNHSHEVTTPGQHREREHVLESDCASPLTARRGTPNRLKAVRS